MTKRSIKVFLIVIVIASAFFFLFHHYLPSKINAANPALQYRQTHTKIVAPAAELPAPVKPSIAIELGVPEPKTVTYAEFRPSNIRKQKKKIRKIFEVPEKIQTEIDFWKDIYTKYDKTKVVFHDKKHMDIVYSVIDLSDIIGNPKYTEAEQIALKGGRVEKERGRIVAILEGLDEKDPSEMNDDEKEIFQMFLNIDEPERFKKAAGTDRLRSQTGIREKFENGIKIAGRYMGEIEKIFSEYKIPLEITRLAFVESMFNLSAVSKVGASGIWQFMPKSGKLFSLTIDEIVDERNDPIHATHAAAKHLLRDYERFGSWPLAINAYNTGPGRIARAVNHLGTTDIAKIIKEFDYPGYAFASRNFYPAFLAALNSFENRNEYFGEIEMDSPLTFDVITTPFFSTVSELSDYTGIPVEELILLNFHLQEDVVKGKLPIPAGFSLKVPKGKGEDFLIAMNEMDRLTKYAKWHIVQPGESLKVIAAKYKTNSTALKKINNIRRNRIKSGQILKLPKGIELAKE